MDISLKTTLRTQLDSIAPEYGLVESTYPSFMRAFGYRCPQLSAADAVEGLNALLEAATGVRIEVEQEGGKGGGEWFGGTKIWSTGVNSTSRSSAAKSTDVGRTGTQNEADELDKNDKLEQKQSERNFWICYDALQEYVPRGNYKLFSLPYLPSE
jgi:cell division control protein 45